MGACWSAWKRTKRTSTGIRVKDLPSPEDDRSFQAVSAGNVTLPTPAEVRARGADSTAIGDKRNRPDLARFPEYGLIVKWGKHITVAEGQCLWFISQNLKDQVAVPAIYAWKRDAEQTFLYMQLICGDTLEDRWSSLTRGEKLRICKQLKAMARSWRRITPELTGSGPAQIGGQPLHDVIFEDGGHYPAGPFSSTAEFHDCFARLCSRSNSHRDPRKEIEGLAGLRDDCSLVFTHADLDQSNIMVSKPGDGPLRIVAIIDWHQSGWYPEPWEFLKAQMVARYDSDWQREFLPKFLKPPADDYSYAFEYISMAVI